MADEQTTQEPDFDLDSFMNDLGIKGASKPLSSEEICFIVITGTIGRFDNTLYELKHQVALYESLLEEGVVACRNGLEGFKPVTRAHYIREILKYYLQMNHLLRFIDKFTYEGQQYEPADLDKTLDLFMEHGSIRKICAGTSK